MIFGMAAGAGVGWVLGGLLVAVLGNHWWVMGLWVWAVMVPLTLAGGILAERLDGKPDAG